jgi:hypothetical protein
MDYPSPTHIQLNVKSLSRSIPNTMPLSHRRHQRYLQLKHQYLHGCGDCHVRIGGSVSPQTQQYKTH